jgi:tol-pal system protein YbgF
MRNASVMPLVLFFVFLVSLGQAQAIAVDATSLMQRLNQLESRLQAAERQRAAPMAPIVTGGQAAPAGGSGYLLNDLGQRLGEMERQQDAQVGAQERLTFAIERLAKRLDDLQRDYEMRLTALEGKLASATAQAQASAAPAAAPTPAALPAAATGVPEGLSATIVYQRGYGYIAAGDYPNANLWLTTFLKRFPTDAMADNAYYWLGEVQLVQNNPRAAAQSFRDGLKAFPKGAKAAGNLLKLGTALNQLGQPQLAKGAWDKLLKDYPAAPEAARARDELTKLSMTKPAAAAPAAPITPSVAPR